jgi:chromosome segregation ATPase
MRPNPLTESRPKISTMPRPKTEATAYLNLYKLSIEKKRLETELTTIDQRRRQIQKRLAFLESQVAEMQKNTQQATPHLTPVEKESAPDAVALNTLFLEY